MKRGKPIKRTGWPTSKAVEQRTAENDRANRKARNIMALLAGAPSAARGVISRIVGVTPAPKNPADRNDRVRELAEGEHCTIRYTPVCLFPRTDTTVGCHANTLAENKGMGYKAHDSGTVFGCSACHDVIDGRDMRHRPDPAEFVELFVMAQVRTRARLEQIVKSPSERPWRQRAAAWAIQQQDARARRRPTGETT